MLSVRRRWALYISLPVLVGIYAPPVLASSAGIDTPLGVTTLPLSVEGGTIMTLKAPNPAAIPPLPAIASVEGNVGIGIGTVTPNSALQVNGEVQPGNSGAACGAGNAGALRYNAVTHSFQGCNGTAWTSVLSKPVLSLDENVSCNGTGPGRGGGQHTDCPVSESDGSGNHYAKPSATVHDLCVLSSEDGMGACAVGSGSPGEIWTITLYPALQASLSCGMQCFDYQ